MDAVLSAILGILFLVWFVGLILFGFYAWAKLTSKSDPPLLRRMKGMGYGIVWPFMVFKLISAKQAESTATAARQQRSRDLLD